MSRWRLALQLSSLAGALCSLSPAPCHAQNPAAAEALFEQARAAMAAGSFDIACARFRDSDKLDPAVGTRFNLADCEERRGRVATAWSLFRGVSAELAQDDDRKPIAEERAAKLKSRLPIVTMVPPPDAAPGMRVRIDGVEIGEASFGVPLPMDPGPHDLSLLPADGPEQRTRFALREGEHTDLPLRAAALPAAPEAASNEPAPSSSDESLRERRRWGYVAGGAGVAGVAFGVVAGVVTLQKKSTADDNCSDATRTCNQTGRNASDTGRTFATLSTVGFGVGVVGLAAGAYLLLTSRSEAAKTAYPSTPLAMFAKVRAELLLERERGFVSVAARF